jgi:hypothetical protein
LQRVQQRTARSPLPTRTTGLGTGASTGTGTSFSTSTGSSSGSSSGFPTGPGRLRHKKGPFANHVADSQRELVLVGLKLELALAKDKAVGLGAEARDLPGGDVDGACLNELKSVLDEVGVVGGGGKRG